MNYPHEWATTPKSKVAICCGCLARRSRLSSADCPAKMRQHIADLSRLQASIIKAQAAGYGAGQSGERAAVCSWLRSGMADPGRGSAAYEESVGAIAREIAAAIEAGKHHLPTSTE